MLKARQMNRLLNILYIGSDRLGSTSHHRADALRRLNHNLFVLDPDDLIGSLLPLQVWFNYHTGYRLLQKSLLKRFEGKVSAWHLHAPINLIWVNGGELIGPNILLSLRATFKCPVVLYQNDDPTGFRDGPRFATLRSSLRFYDLCVLVRPETTLEALAMGAVRCLRVFMSYDEKIHAPTAINSIHPFWMFVSFVGAYIPGERRDEFLLCLINAGLPLRLIGNQWQKSKLWSSLKSYFYGLGITGSAYAEALGYSGVSLGLLSSGNRDLLTRRSVEIPACGGLLCAERTSEHQLFFEDGTEAVFWSTAQECIAKCNHLLREPSLNMNIRRSGQVHVYQIGVGNEDICRHVLACLSLT